MRYGRIYLASRSKRASLDISNNLRSFLYPKKIECSTKNSSRDQKMFDQGIKTPKLIIENLEKIPNIQVPLLKDFF
jgi:hypothetical protein